LLVLDGERVFRVEAATDKIDNANSMPLSAFILNHNIDFVIAGFDFLHEVEIHVVEPLVSKSAKFCAFLRDNENRSFYA
jgi:hypothetical protein